MDKKYLLLIVLMFGSLIMLEGVRAVSMQCDCRVGQPGDCIPGTTNPCPIGYFDCPCPDYDESAAICIAATPTCTNKPPCIPDETYSCQNRYGCVGTQTCIGRDGYTTNNYSTCAISPATQYVPDNNICTTNELINCTSNATISYGISSDKSTTCGVGACKTTITQTCSVASNDWLPVCTPGTPSTEICTDGIDNDCDGKTDIYDSNCCPSDHCINGGACYDPSSILDFDTSLDYSYKTCFNGAWYDPDTLKPTIPATADNCDVTEDDCYCDITCSSHSEGGCNGVANNYFCPSNDCTRDQTDCREYCGVSATKSLIPRNNEFTNNYLLMQSH